MIRKWKQPPLKKVSNIYNYLVKKDYQVMLGFIDIGGGQQHVNLIKGKYPNHDKLDIIYKPNYTWGINQAPCLEVFYKALKDGE